MKRMLVLFLMIVLFEGCKKTETFGYGLEENMSVKRGFVAALCVDKDLRGLRQIPVYCDVGSDGDLISGKYILMCDYIEKTNVLEFKLTGKFGGDKSKILTTSKKYIQLSKRVIQNVLESDFAGFEYVFCVFDSQTNMLWEYREGELLLINNGSVHEEQPFSRHKKKPKTKGKG